MYGRFGRGRGNGAGFGFKGSSPLYPYIGRGRGGLPRCGYYLPYESNTGADLTDLEKQRGLIKEQIARVESRIAELEKTEING